MLRILSSCSLFFLASVVASGESSVTYFKDGRADSINLDMSVADAKRQEQGALVIIARGVIENQPVRLKLLIDGKWTVREEEQGTYYRVDLKLLADGEESAAIDELVRRSFKMEPKHTLFCSSGYAGLTATHREDLNRKATKFFADDAGLCGGFHVQIGLDLEGKSLKLAIFESAAGRTYPDRIQ